MMLKDVLKDIIFLCLHCASLSVCGSVWVLWSVFVLWHILLSNLPTYWDFDLWKLKSI